MPRFEFEAGGVTFQVEARTEAEAVSKARHKVARERSISQAELGARARSDKGLDDPLSPEFQALRAQGEREGTAAAAGPVATQLALAPVFAAGSAALGGLAAGARGLPVLGRALQFATSRPGAATIGAIEEGVRTGSPVEAAKGALLGAALGRSRGPVGRVVGMADDLVGAEAGAARTAAPAAVAPPPVAAPAPPPAAPAVADAAAVAKAEADMIAAQLLRWKEGGMSGGQMVASLRQLYGISPKVGGDMVRMLGVNVPTRGRPVAAAVEAAAAESAPVQAAAPPAASPLKGPRVEVGAQRVGREAGMTKEQVRQATGPLYGEAQGAASPAFPQATFDKLYDKMRAMPPSERIPYANLAKDEKAMTQLITIARGLAKEGLVVPLAVIAEAIRRREAEE